MGSKSLQHCDIMASDNWILDFFSSPTEYGAEVFIIIAVIVIAVITLAIVLSVILCKRKKTKAAREKEPLNSI